VTNSERVLGDSNKFFVDTDNDHYLGSTRRPLNANSKNDFDFSQNFNDLSEIPGYDNFQTPLHRDSNFGNEYALK
jgi:hypothetical protein